jgi:hypothetical protein
MDAVDSSMGSEPNVMQSWSLMQHLAMPLGTIALAQLPLH